MNTRLSLLLACTVLFWSCKKLTEPPKETCFIPYVDFVAQHVDPATLEVSFTSVTSFNGTISSHYWEFGDGSTFSGPNPPPHHYPASSSTGSQTYRIKYTVANECGQSYWTKEITVSACLPSVGFTTAVLNDSTVQFTNTSSSSTPVTYLWDFGDGTTSTASTPSLTHVYHSDGVFTVRLRATNGCGDNFFTAPVSVCRPAQPAQNVTMTSCATVSIDASATQNGARYQWDFGNGTVLPATPSASPQITYTYPGSGTYIIRMAVINPAGCDTAFATHTVTINGAAVVPNNNWSYTSDDLDFNFSRAPVTNANSYSWNFGDNTTSAQQNPGTHTYNSPGTYTVSLGASNGCGSFNFSATITVPYFKAINGAPNTGFLEVVAISPQQIYFLATNGKLYKSDTTGNWSNAINLPSGLNFNANTTHLYRDRNNNLWIYGRNEIAKFNTSNFTWTSSYNATGYANNTTIEGMTVDNNGNLWTVADSRVKRGNTTISSGNNIDYSSIAFAPSTGRIWVTAANRNTLFYATVSGNSLSTVNSGGIGTGADQVHIEPGGDLYVRSGSTIVRYTSTGSLLNSFASGNTAGQLNAAPDHFDFDNRGNLWALVSGRLIRIPINASNTAKNYSFTPELSSLAFFDLLDLSGTDSDIILAKTSGNAATKIR